MYNNTTSSLPPSLSPSLYSSNPLSFLPTSIPPPSLPPSSVETIYPIQNPTALQDQRVSSLIQYAMKVEKAMFEMATSREEYYQLLAEKIYRIRKELDERRKIKLEMEKRKQMGEGGFTQSLFIEYCEIQYMYCRTVNL